MRTCEGCGDPIRWWEFNCHNNHSRCAETRMRMANRLRVCQAFSTSPDEAREQFIKEEDCAARKGE